MKFKKQELKRNELAEIKGGTTTTLAVQTGIWENEYDDTNGNGIHDEGDIEIPGYEKPDPKFN